MYEIIYQIPSFFTNYALSSLTTYLWTAITGNTITLGLGLVFAGVIARVLGKPVIVLGIVLILIGGASSLGVNLNFASLATVNLGH